MAQPCWFAPCHWRAEKVVTELVQKVVTELVWKVVTELVILWHKPCLPHCWCNLSKHSWSGFLPLLKHWSVRNKQDEKLATPQKRHKIKTKCCVYVFYYWSIYWSFLYSAILRSQEDSLHIYFISIERTCDASSAQYPFNFVLLATNTRSELANIPAVGSCLNGNTVCAVMCRGSAASEGGVPL